MIKINAESIEEVLELDKIIQSSNTRLVNEDLSWMMDSLKKVNKCLQLPAVNFINNQYELIWGNHRVAAMKKLGWKSHKFLVYFDLTPLQVMDLRYIENADRRNLNDLENARATCQYLNEFKYSKKEIALRLGLSLKTVENHIKLYESSNKLGEDFNEKFNDIPALSLSNAIDILLKDLNSGNSKAVGIETVKKFIEFFKTYSPTVKKATKVAKIYRNGTGISGYIPKEGLSKNPFLNIYRYLEEIEPTGISILIPKSEMARLSSLHKGSKKQIIRNILSGKLKETINFNMLNQ